MDKVRRRIVLVLADRHANVGDYSWIPSDIYVYENVLDLKEVESIADLYIIDSNSQTVRDVVFDLYPTVSVHVVWDYVDHQEFSYSMLDLATKLQCVRFQEYGSKAELLFDRRIGKDSALHSLRYFEKNFLKDRTNQISIDREVIEKVALQMDDVANRLVLLQKENALLRLQLNEIAYEQVVVEKEHELFATLKEAYRELEDLNQEMVEKFYNKEI